MCDSIEHARNRGRRAALLAAEVRSQGCGVEHMSYADWVIAAADAGLRSAPSEETVAMAEGMLSALEEEGVSA